MKKIETGIYRRDDGRLYVRTTAKDPYTGKIVQRQQTLTEDQTLKQAQQIRDDLKAEIAGRRDVGGPSARTIRDYARWWLNSKMADLSPAVRHDYVFATERLCEHMGGLELGHVVRADLQEWVGWAESLRQPVPPNRWLRATRRTSESDARKRVIDYLKANGETELRDVLKSVRTTRTTIDRMLKAEQIRERVEELPPAPYSTHTLRGWWRIVLVMIRDAVADGLIQGDPTERVRPPKTTVSQVQEKQTLSARELGEFVEAASRVSAGRYAEIVTLAYTGMRPGELYGLQWEDIDWAGERIQIQRTVSRRKLRGTTKTGSARETYMPPIVARAIREHHERLLKEESLHELVFPSDVGTPRGSDTLRRPMDRAAREAGIDMTVRPQVLRRTFNTLLIGAGVDRIVQRSMIGHTSEQMTERYAGVRIEEKRAAVLRIVGDEEVEG